VNEPLPAQGLEALEQPPGNYAGRTRYTQLEYDALLANASIGIAFTRERRFFLCNQKFNEMFGWSADELIGQPGEVVYPSAESYAALGQIAVPILSAGRQLDLEWELRRKDGSTFLARLIAKSLDHENAQHGTVWIVEDITDKRRQSDELQRLLREQAAILGSASIGIVFVRERRIVRCNRRYEEMYGYEPHELEGRPTALLYANPDEQVTALPDIDEQLARGQTARRVEQCRRKDGTAFWTRADGRAVDPQNPARGSVWTVEDITEQRRVEDARSRAHDALERLVREQEAVLENRLIGICFIKERRITRCNRRFSEIFGYAEAELVNASTRFMFTSDADFEAGIALYEPIWRGQTQNLQKRYMRKDGAAIWCSVSGRAVQAGNPGQGSVWLFEDVTQEREAEEKIERALAEQELILDNAAVGIAFVRARAIQRCNRFLEDMVGAGPGELVGQSSATLFASRADWEDAVHKAYSGTAPGGTHDSEWRFKRRDGSVFVCRTRGRRTDTGEAEQEWIWSFEDVTAEREADSRVHLALGELERVVAERTAELQAANSRLETEIEERKHAEQLARHLASHDALTGLPNRRLLEDRLTQALAMGQRNRQHSAVMFVDLDRFKNINDSLGHAVGDILLCEVAQRLVKQLRVGDTICRIGGDEFVVVLPEVKRADDVAQVAQKVIDQLSQPVLVEERELIVTPSIGIAVFPEDGRDAETLIRNADAAMYHAKQMGRANYQFFTERMNQAASRRLTLEGDLRRALGKDELRVHYQPIVAAGGARVAGHEALVRWQHPERGLVPPSEFIQLAEETGLILAIGQWVLREACRWATFIGVERGLQVSVNLSARQFNDPRLVEVVAAALRDTGLPANLLELEITESTAMRETDVTLSTLTRLKELGVSIAIDDFGTGYSSLAYLKRFPVDKVKVDRAFVADLPRDPDQNAIVAAIIALAHALDIQVIAEGVETEEQRGFLQACGCDFVQGFLVGPPLDADTAAQKYL
jgi:diguanylate cyclase (GGDEF)-like protein/PAS domain S-box-containing protein